MTVKEVGDRPKATQRPVEGTFPATSLTNHLCPLSCRDALFQRAGSYFQTHPHYLAAQPWLGLSPLPERPFSTSLQHPAQILLPRKTPLGPLQSGYIPPATPETLSLYHTLI